MTRLHMPTLTFTTCGEPTEDPSAPLFEAIIDGRVVRATCLAALLRDEIILLDGRAQRQEAA